jgi:hypothetical protein
VKNVLTDATLNEETSNPVGLFFADSNSGGDGVFSGSEDLYALVNHGVIRTRLDVANSYSGSVPTVGIGPWFNYEITAGFTDTITILSEEEQGDGHGSWIFVIRGDVSATAEGLEPDDVVSSASAGLSVTVNGENVAGISSSANAMGGSGPDSFTQTIALDFDFRFGESFELSVMVKNRAIIDSILTQGNFQPISFTAKSDFSKSFEWQGMGEVTNGSGQVVSNFQVISESGTDYTAGAVPTEVESVGGLKALFGRD